MAQAVELVHGNPTEADLQRLRTDEALQEAVRMALDMQTAARREAAPVDVEARLRAFHEGHEANNARPRTQLVAGLLAVAAMIIAAVLIVKPWVQTPAEDPFFTQQTQQTTDSVELQTAGGRQIALKQTDEQSQTITMADLREAFAEAEAEDNENMTLHVPYGRSADIMLPDGSMVYLHPGARLLFPTQFPTDKRVVKLDGEAYFKVAKDAQRPFTVMTQTMETTVLGTEFNINTAARQVTLVSGSVSVKNNATRKKQVLTPGQQLTETESGQQTLTMADTTPYKYWRDGYIYFDDAPLDEVLSTIAACYSKQVTFRDSAAQHLRMRYFTERNKGVEQALNMINSMNHVKVSLEGNKIVVE